MDLIEYFRGSVGPQDVPVKTLGLFCSKKKERTEGGWKDPPVKRKEAVLAVHLSALQLPGPSHRADSFTGGSSAVQGSLGMLRHSPHCSNPETSNLISSPPFPSAPHSLLSSAWTHLLPTHHPFPYSEWVENGGLGAVGSMAETLGLLEAWPLSPAPLCHSKMQRRRANQNQRPSVTHYYFLRLRSEPQCRARDRPGCAPRLTNSARGLHLRVFHSVNLY